MCRDRFYYSKLLFQLCTLSSFYPLSARSSRFRIVQSRAFTAIRAAKYPSRMRQCAYVMAQFARDAQAHITLIRAIVRRYVHAYTYMSGCTDEWMDGSEKSDVMPL